MDKLIENLKELGFNTYESKVYVALLKKHPATGYEISKIANIPQARTYDTLKALLEKKVIISTSNKPAEYSPINPKELTKQFKRKMLSTLEYLDSHLPEVREDYSEPVLNLKGETNIKKKANEIIKSAQKEIYVEIWPQDFPEIEEELFKAYDRNVEVRVVAYGNLKPNFGLIYEHPFSKNIENSLDGRMVILCVDNKEALMGKIHSSKPDATNVMWTKNTDVIFLIKELIVHDMYLLDIQENLFEELKYTYGKGFKRLHDKILGVNNPYNIHSFTSK